MKEKFLNRCAILKDRSDVLEGLLDTLKLNIIIQDLSHSLDVQVRKGTNLIPNIGWVEEIIVGNQGFDLINKLQNKCNSYDIYTKKEYYISGIIQYKNEFIAPCIDGEARKLIEKHSNKELGEILFLIDQLIENVNKDIDYVHSNPNIRTHEHYYGECNKGFPSHYRYETVSDVFDDYKTI